MFQVGHKISLSACPPCYSVLPASSQPVGVRVHAAGLNAVREQCAVPLRYLENWSMTATEIVQAWFEMCRTGDEARLAGLATDDFTRSGPRTVAATSTCPLTASRCGRPESSSCGSWTAGWPSPGSRATTWRWRSSSAVASVLDDVPDADGGLGGVVAVPVRGGRVERHRVAAVQRQLLEAQRQHQVAGEQEAELRSRVAHQVAGARRGTPGRVGDPQEVDPAAGQRAQPFPGDAGVEGEDLPLRRPDERAQPQAAHGK